MYVCTYRHVTCDWALQFFQLEKLSVKKRLSWTNDYNIESVSAVNKFWSRRLHWESRWQPTFRGRELPRGVWGHAPRKFWNLDTWKCCFQRFPDSIWALRTIKIKTILTIIYSMFITTVLFLKISITGF